ncbi:hypothetical protein MFIFM68171_09387 [Madurella fahalii]|uniref:FAM192A/Fyv6 N-terminal domain-containing protein n=1 Tax=Madurella fahalii TaxID=1157608 RepID=A0ABQ0GN37_9PEZI
MSSRFISAGAINAATGEAATTSPPAGSTPPTTTATTTSTAPKNPSAARRQEEWAEVTRQLEADRRQRAEAALRKSSAAGEHKSLYDVLQANKAAKQAAFEEAHRLRNQFRALDDDEVDFLDGVRRARREEEERVRRETEEGLRAFRRLQGVTGGSGSGSGSATAGAGEGGGVGDGEMPEADEMAALVGWEGSGRRKRAKGDMGRGRKRVKGLGVRKESTGGSEDGGSGAVEGKTKGGEGGLAKEKETVKETGPVGGGEGGGPKEEKPVTALPPAPATGTAKPGGLLVDYGSDDDDD